MMEFNIKPADLMREIYQAVRNNTNKTFKSNSSNAVLKVLILTGYNEVVNKGNYDNLIFEPLELENISTDNVKLDEIHCTGNLWGLY